MHITRALPALLAWAAMAFCGSVTLAKEDKGNGKDRPAAAGQKAGDAGDRDCHLPPRVRSAG